MWRTVIKQRFGYLRCIIILSSVVLTLNLVIVLGKCLLFYSMSYIFNINICIKKICIF